MTTPNLLAWYNRVLVLAGSMPIHYEVSEKKKYGRFTAKDGEVVHHIRVFSPRALSEMLKDIGFTVIEVKGLRFVFGRGRILDSFFSNFPTTSSTSFINLAGYILNYAAKTMKIIMNKAKALYGEDQTSATRREPNSSRLQSTVEVDSTDGHIGQYGQAKKDSTSTLDSLYMKLLQTLS